MSCLQCMMEFVKNPMIALLKACELHLWDMTADMGILRVLADPIGQGSGGGLGVECLKMTSHM